MSTLQFFTGWSLVDITPTGVTRSRPGQEQQRDQQRNWETVLQCISLRAQPLEISEPRAFDTDSLSWLEFGEMYEDQLTNRGWVFTFAVEHVNVFEDNGDPVALLNEAVNQVPIVSGLEETARFILPIFYTNGAIKNIYFKPGRIDLK